MFVEEKIKLIIEKEVERLYDLSQTIGLTEEQIRALKVIYEISKQQVNINDDKEAERQIKKVDVLELLQKARSSERREENSDNRCGES